MKTNLKYFIIGLVLGVVFAVMAGGMFYKFGRHLPWEKALAKVEHKVSKVFQGSKPEQNLHAEFSNVQEFQNNFQFGSKGWLTSQMFGNGRFEWNQARKTLTQVSENYRDSAMIRSSKPLPKTYRLSVVVGEINYGLENLEGLSKDPDFSEGPLNENGCYLLTITDTPPVEPHTNIWWHHHRKVTVDVDNNVWGHGMPNPIFMAYFNADNRLRTYNAKTKQWGPEWESALHYDPVQYYRITIEKTEDQYKYTLALENGKVLHRIEVPIKEVWRKNEADYFVLGEPHMNYYQGSLKIKKIHLSY